MKAIAFALLAMLTLAGTPPAGRNACPRHFASGTEPTLANAKLAAGTRRLCYGSFAVLHSSVARVPLYAAEHLTRASVQAAERLDTRDNRFHPEERLAPAERAELADYARSGFDRGHMAPSGDMGDPRADYESFSLANIVPQAGALNRNSWAAMEGYVRDLTLKLGEAYVVTGPAYEGAKLRRLNGRVLVPTSVWKAVWVPGQGAGAWIATNAARPSWEVVSITALAARTGIDPFPTLDVATRTKVPAFPTFGGRAAPASEVSHMIKPFADDEGASSIGDLSVENGRRAVVISGTLAVTRDKAGLERARALKELADSLVAALETAGDLPDRIPADRDGGEKVDNPFA